MSCSFVAGGIGVLLFSQTTQDSKGPIDGAKDPRSARRRAINLNTSCILGLPNTSTVELLMTGVDRTGFDQNRLVRQFMTNHECCCPLN